ncbi:hypothetical protein MK079_05500, partial [Candidatus Gracilibacteria bacterium]|nr:hypothetical protein [Candidatus Gracilibacteria bacterium]
MTKHDKDETQAQDIIEEMQQEIEEIEDESGEINEEKLEEAQGTPDPKESSALEQLAKVQADF